MMHKTLAIAIAAGIAASLAGSGSVSAADPAVIKIGSHSPDKSKHMRLVIKPWMRQVEKDSGGTLVFKEFWGGALIRSPRKQYEGMLNGIQDASPVLPSYTIKLFPDFSLFALPYLFRDSYESSTVMWKMYEKGLIGGLDKVYVAAVYSNDNSGMHFNRKITSLDDIKGLKIRASGSEEADIIKELGATPVGMSITQVAESLNRGVIQGSMNGWSALRSFKIEPLVKSDIDVPFGVRTFFLGITNKAMARLPAKAKAALDRNSGLKLSQALGADFKEDGDRYRSEAVKNPDRHVVRLEGAQAKAMAKRMKKFHDAWVKSHKDGKKKYDALQAILADLRKSS